MYVLLRNTAKVEANTVFPASERLDDIGEDGIMVSFALKAAEQLKNRGIDARVINMSSIKPLDRPALIKAYPLVSLHIQAH